MQIKLREYQQQDFEALEAIIRETWHYDDFSSPKTAIQLAKVFLSSCLTNYTFSRVAVVDGTAAGIILVNQIAKHKCPLSNRLLQIKSILSLYSSKEGRDRSAITKRNKEDLSGRTGLVCCQFFVQRKRDRKNAFSIRAGLYAARKIRRILLIYRHKL